MLRRLAVGALRQASEIIGRSEIRRFDALRVERPRSPGSPRVFSSCFSIFRLWPVCSSWCCSMRWMKEWTVCSADLAAMLKCKEGAPAVVLAAHTQPLGM